MLNRVPILIIILIIVFLITSLISFITIDKVVTPESIEEEKLQTSTAGGVVKINIANPDYEKEGIDSETDTK